MSSVAPPLSYLYTGNPPVLTHHKNNLQRVINSIPELDPALSSNPVYIQSYKMLNKALEEYKRGLTLPDNSEEAIAAFSKSAKLYEGALDHLYDFEEFERPRQLKKYLDDLYNKVFHKSMNEGKDPNEADEDARYQVEEAEPKFTWYLFSMPPSKKLTNAKKRLQNRLQRSSKRRNRHNRRNRKTRKN